MVEDSQIGYAVVVVVPVSKNSGPAKNLTKKAGNEKAIRRLDKLFISLLTGKPERTQWKIKVRPDLRTG